MRRNQSGVDEKKARDQRIITTSTEVSFEARGVGIFRLSPN